MDEKGRGGVRPEGAAPRVHQCGCPACAGPGEHPAKRLHRHMNLLLSRMGEQQRRWYAALESEKLGHGGDRRMALVTGMSVGTIRRGRLELEGELDGRPAGRERLPGGGRPAVGKKTPPWGRL